MDEPKADRWAEQFIAGDPRAIGDAIRLIRVVVEHRGYYISEQDRPEVMQETLAQIWSAVTAQGARAPHDFSSFIRAIAHRRCVDWIRKHTITEALPLDFPAPDRSPESGVLASEKADLGARILRQLAEPCRDLLRMHAIEGLTIRLIAELQGRHERAVRSQLHRCLQSAREVIEKLRRRERLGLDARRSDA